MPGESQASPDEAGQAVADQSNSQLVHSHGDFRAGAARRRLRAQLRLKVMAGVVVVTLVALAAFDVGAVTTMRRYLLTQTDNNLKVALTLTKPRLAAILADGLPPGRPGDRAVPAQFSYRPTPRSRRFPALSTWPSCRTAAPR